MAKLQKLAREVLGEAIQKLKDPRIGFTTVTSVRITPDLRHARVFVSVLGSDDERAATMDGLASATPVLRAELGRQVRMKYLPELHLELDPTPEQAERVEALLRRIHEGDSGGAGAARYDAPDWDEAVRVLGDAAEVAIACHVNPDGDALGSTLAASLGLRKLGVKTYPSWGERPVEVPSSYAFLPGGDSVLQVDDVPAAEVFLALDCGAADRL